MILFAETNLNKTCKATPPQNARAVKRRRRHTQQSAAKNNNPNVQAKAYRSGLARGSGSIVNGCRPARRRWSVVARPPRPLSGPGQARSSPRRRASPYAPHTWHQVIPPDTHRRCSCPGTGLCFASSGRAGNTGALHAATQAATHAASLADADAVIEPLSSSATASATCVPPKSMVGS